MKRLKASWKLNEDPMTIEEFSAKLYENNKDFLENPHMYDYIPGIYTEHFTTERVAPADCGEQNVEQQTEVEDVQLSQKVPEQS